MGANGLSFAAPAVAGNSGLLQSQGIDLGPWAAEAGVLRLTEVLSGEGEGDGRNSDASFKLKKSRFLAAEAVRNDKF
jgi:hypothetical protein